MNHTRIKPYLILFLLIAAVYWPLAIFQIQYDFLDCWLPWRHFISKSFHNGIFPLWNPYQQLGYPIHADLQGPIFSFENFITGNLFYTNLFTLQMLVFSYLLVAAFGMYKLCAFLYKSHKAALIIALAYVCGGMFIHHLQHFFSIVSFACFPLSIYFFWQMLQLQKWKYVFGLVPLLTLQFTTGNQTFNIINLHIFVIIAIIFIFQYYKAQYTQGIKIILIRCTTLILLTLLCILPILISYWQTKNLVPRYEGISYEKIIGNSMSLISFSGFFNPFITTQHSDFLDNDPSMTGIFFGYLLLVSSFGFFIFSKSRYKIFIFATLLFFILMALGKNTVFHFFVIKIDPLLGLFRFPSYYMFYVYFILLLIAGYFLRDIFIGKIEFKKLAYILLGSTVIYTFIFFFIVFDKGVFFYYFRHFDFRQAFDSMSLSVSFSIAYILVFIFTLLFAILYIINKIKYFDSYFIYIIQFMKIIVFK